MKTITKTFTIGEQYELPGGSFFIYMSGNSTSLLNAVYYKADAQLFDANVLPGYFANFEKNRYKAFDRIVVTSLIAQTCIFGVSSYEGGYNVASGSVTVTAIASGTSLAPISPVTVDTTVDLICAASASRRAIHFCNKSGVESVYLGGSGVTVANAAIILAPGEEYRETDGAAAAWYGITNATSAVVNALEIS